MRRILKEEVDQLVRHNKLLAGEPDRPGLLLTSTGDIVKFFYRRRLISRNLISAQAGRFKLNSIRLQQLNIAAPQVTDVMFCAEVPVHAVVYPYIEGIDLRRLCAAGDLTTLDDLPAYLAHLHREGIFFRAIHLANVLKLSNGGYGLLDITDLSLRSRPLTALQRARNVAHLLGNRDDQDSFDRYGLTRFLRAYLSAANLASAAQRRFTWRLKLALPDWKSRLR